MSKAEKKEAECAEVPMPEPYCHLTTGSVEWMRNSPETRTVSATASGKPNENTRPVFLVEQMQLYGDDREAAGYAQVLGWAVSRWKDEVENRPLENKNRRALDDVWRQVVRFAGGDPDVLLGPSHDAALRGEVKP